MSQTISLFTPQESKVLTQVIKGYTSKEISDNLNLSKKTIDSYKSNMLKKANCKNMCQLVYFAAKNKWVQ